MSKKDILLKAWELRSKTQGNIFVCFAAIITNAENPIKYVFETKPSDAMTIYRNWKQHGNI